MKKLPSYYEFQHGTKIMSGDYALERIPDELEKLGAGRPIILSDGVLKKIGTLQWVIDACLANGMEPGSVYHEIPADSSSAVVNDIAAVYRKNRCDSIIAVGGGSVIDTAKGLRMLLSQDVEDIMELSGCENLSAGKRVPFAAVPTTSGTGSESTLVAVIRNAVSGIKMEFISYYLQPDIAVLDVRMTMTLPPSITASTGMDTLCHAVEAFSCMQKNPLSDVYAGAAIVLVRDYLEASVKNGKDKEARLAMANASMMAGAAFSNSMVGMVHAIGHALGGVCHVPHANAMTILMPHCMRYNMDVLSDVYGELLFYLAGAERFVAVPEKDRGWETVKVIEELEERLHQLCGFPLTLSEAGVKREDFDAVIQAALDDGAIIVNPKKVNKEDVRFILNQAYE